MISKLTSLLFLCSVVLARGGEFTINSNNVFVMNGKRIFPIRVSIGPPADASAPDGRSAIQELALSGVNFMRTGVQGRNWTQDQIKLEHQYEDVCARYGVYCLVNLRDLSSIDAPTNNPREQFLRQVVNEFKKNTAL